MHISRARRNKPLSNGSFGPAATVDYVKYYLRAFLRSTMSTVLKLTDGIGILTHLVRVDNVHVNGSVKFDKLLSRTDRGIYNWKWSTDNPKTLNYSGLTTTRITSSNYISTVGSLLYDKRRMNCIKWQPRIPLNMHSVPTDSISSSRLYSTSSTKENRYLPSKFLTCRK